ncbi:MAG: hypothetical protein K2G32_04880, partial [Oscillospiraceae bacterium]|nr:hypothetical protein [Oscillospiraceae bacterium]
LWQNVINAVLFLLIVAFNFRSGVRAVNLFINRKSGKNGAEAAQPSRPPQRRYPERRQPPRSRSPQRRPPPRGLSERRSQGQSRGYPTAQSRRAPPSGRPQTHNPQKRPPPRKRP